MALSVSDAVIEILGGMHFLRTAMTLDLINYSALARAIRPQVEKKMNGKVELETIIMAIRRNAHVLTAKKTAAVFDVLKESKVDLVTGMCFVKLKRSQIVLEQLLEFAKTVNAEQMESLYIIQRVDEIAIVMPETLIPKLEKMPVIKKDPETIKEKQGDLAAITVRLPSFTVEVPGVYALITNSLSDLGVSLLTILGSFGRSSFVCSEEDAPLVYDKINSLIRESKETAKLNEQ